MGREKVRDLVDLMKQREGYRMSKGFEMSDEEFEEDGLLEGMSILDDEYDVPTEEEIEEALRATRPDDKRK